MCVYYVCIHIYIYIYIRIHTYPMCVCVCVCCFNVEVAIHNGIGSVSHVSQAPVGLRELAAMSQSDFRQVVA